jgi:hypothetical protein
LRFLNIQLRQFQGRGQKKTNLASSPIYISPRKAECRLIGNALWGKINNVSFRPYKNGEREPEIRLIIGVVDINILLLHGGTELEPCPPYTKLSSIESKFLKNDIVEKRIRAKINQTIDFYIQSPEENFPVLLCVALNGMVKQHIFLAFWGWNLNF